jgi:hypothetical protein
LWQVDERPRDEAMGTADGDGEEEDEEGEDEEGEDEEVEYSIQ